MYAAGQISTDTKVTQSTATQAPAAVQPSPGQDGTQQGVPTSPATTSKVSKNSETQKHSADFAAIRRVAHRMSHKYSGKAFEQAVLTVADGTFLSMITTNKASTKRVASDMGLESRDTRTHTAFDNRPVREHGTPLVTTLVTNQGDAAAKQQKT